MTSTISSGSKAHQFFSMYRWSMRKNMATTIVYSVFLLFSYPLVLGFARTLSLTGLTMIEEDTILSLSRNVYPALTGSIAMLFTLLVPVFMFSYMHKKRSVDMFGALPMSRRTLFFSRYLAGLTLLLIPLVLCTGIGMLLSLPSTGAIETLLNGMFCIMFATIVSYTFTAFIAVCCGTTADTVISVLAINCLYPAAVGVCQLLSTSIVPGVFTAIEPTTLGYTALSPYVTGITSAFGDSLGYGASSIFEMPGQLLCWFVLFAACFAGCVVLSKRRKAESAQAGFAFRLPAIIVRFIASATVGLFFASMFGAVSSSVTFNGVMQHHFWFIMGLIIGAFITHLVVTFIYNRGVKGFLKSLIPYAVTIVVILAGYAVLVTGMFGSDMYVPKADEVKSVRFLVNSSVNAKDYYANGEEVPRAAAEFKEKKEIENVLSLHNKITENMRGLVGYPYTLYTGNQYNGVGDSGHEMNMISIEYTLENGSKVFREYNDSQYKAADLKNDVLKLTSSGTYKEEATNLFVYGSERITEITSRGNSNFEDDQSASTFYDGNGATLINKGEITELAAALKQDILEDPDFGINSLNTYTAEGVNAVVLDIYYKISKDTDSAEWNNPTHDLAESITVPQTYKRTWEVLGKYMMRPISDEEIKKSSYVNALFNVPDPAKNDTIAGTIEGGILAALKHGDLDWFTVTLQVPQGWDEENVYCALTGTPSNQQFDVKYGELSKCRQGKSGTVTFTVPNDSFTKAWGTIQFYDKAGNATQKISIEQVNGANLTVAPGETFQAESGKEYTLFEIDYNDLKG